MGYGYSGVGTTQIGNGSVTADKLASDSVTNAKIAAGAVDTAELAASAVTTVKIGPGAITADKIAPGAVEAATITNGSIVRAKLEADIIDATKLADDAVGSEHIQTNAVGASELADNAVDTNAIANLAVTAGKIANDTITATQIAANAVGASELADNAVDTNAIADGAITAAKFAAGAVGTASVTDNSITSAKLVAALRDVLGIDNADSKRRGVKSIAGIESTSSGAYTALTTPDRVANIVLPTDGILRIGYQALWAVGSGTASAAIFINGNQIKVAASNSAPVTQGANHSGGFYAPLFTGPQGLVSGSGTSSHATNVTTGQMLGASGANGGFVEVFAAAGTYTVEIRFANASTVLAKERKLWVEAIGFPAE